MLIFNRALYICIDAKRKRHKDDQRDDMWIAELWVVFIFWFLSLSIPPGFYKQEKPSY